MAKKPPPKPSPSVPPKAGAESGQREVTTDDFLSRLSPEDRARLEQQEQLLAQVRAFAKDNPEEAGQLLRVWLSKGRGK